VAPVVAGILDDANNATISRASLKRNVQIANHKQAALVKGHRHESATGLHEGQEDSQSSRSSCVNSSVITTKCRSHCGGDNKAHKKTARVMFWRKTSVSPKPWNKPAMLELGWQERL
jgi:hypothetical protein